jgi:hypothetical protein
MLGTPTIGGEVNGLRIDGLDEAGEETLASGERMVLGSSPRRPKLGEALRH